MLRAARALILLRCVPWCVAYWPACSCSHVSQQGSMDCAPPPPPAHLTVDTDKCMKMYETQTSEPEKQTGEMESGEVKNSTTDKVIVKPDNLRSTVWRFFLDSGQLEAKLSTNPRVFASYAMQNWHITRIPQI